MGGGGWDHWDWEDDAQDKNSSRYERKLTDFSAEELKEALEKVEKQEILRKEVELESKRRMKENRILQLKQELAELEKE
jgi:hypothetical protein